MNLIFLHICKNKKSILFNLEKVYNFKNYLEYFENVSSL